uniref:Putative secreted protein n=1 Tax=Ixodes ricinus TaxID=34613 RepID=A0A6B0UHN6_IXORI
MLYFFLFCICLHLFFCFFSSVQGAIWICCTTSMLRVIPTKRTILYFLRAMQTFCQTKLHLTIVDPFSVAKVSLSEQSIYTTAHCTFILPAEKKK